MPQYRLSRYNNFKQGFAPIWIILIIFVFGGLFFLSKGNINMQVSKNPVGSPAVVPGVATPTSKKVSLYDLCQSEIKTLPKLPFEYEGITSTGSSAEQYRKDRIKDKKYMEDYAACGLRYSTINVIEKTYTSLGLQYYNYIKDVGNVWNTTDINKFPEKLDNVYGEILKKQGWVRQTKIGGERLGYGLPTLIYYKDMGDKNYYIDVVVSPDPAILELLIVKKYPA